MNYVLFIIFCGLFGGGFFGLEGLKAGLIIGTIPVAVHYAAFALFFVVFTLKLTYAMKKNGTTIEQELDKLKATKK